MIEAFRHDAGSVYHIVKRCLVECPAFVNGSAEHTRCCAKEACNDVISIGNIARTLTHSCFCYSYVGPTLRCLIDSWSVFYMKPERAKFRRSI